MPVESPSILNSMKKALSMPEDYTPFDEELKIFINAELSTLNQLGLGPDTGFAITGPAETWADFLGEDLRYNLAMQYMYLSVRLIFDPPQLSSVLTSFENLRLEASVRLNTQREDIVHPPAIEVVDVVVIGDMAEGV